jgi:hypothetical protein
VHAGELYLLEELGTLAQLARDLNYDEVAFFIEVAMESIKDLKTKDMET